MADAIRPQRGPSPTDDHRNPVDRVSIRAHVFSDDAGNQSAASNRIVEECSDPRLDFGTNAGIGGRRERVQVGGPDVGACDFAAARPLHCRAAWRGVRFPTAGTLVAIHASSASGRTPPGTLPAAVHLEDPFVDDQITVRPPTPLGRTLRRTSRRLARRPSQVVRMALEAFLQGAPSADGKRAERVEHLIGSLSSATFPDCI